MENVCFLYAALQCGGPGIRSAVSAAAGNGLYHHTLCPIISVVSYIFFEPHVHVWLLPALVTLTYGIIMEILNALEIVDGPYPFFRVRHQSRAATVLWTAALFGAVSALSFALAQVD